MLRLTYYLLVLLVTIIHAADYYDLLGISKDADNREIRRAFKKLALKLHPDKNQGEEKSHEQFIAINKAYEVLKDDESRKKYDLYGEEGLKQDFHSGWKGNYHSWNYYYESFGIYDDDPEIITLNKNDFEQSVIETSDVWFINFYSPQCSHCHDLAPAWRELAREFEGVLQIGAVNCEEEWSLCRKQNIQSYPSLILYPQKERYQGLRDVENMAEYILQMLPYNVIELNSEKFSETILSEALAFKPWLIFTCIDADGCIYSGDLQKLGIIFDHLVNVAVVDKEADVKICNIVDCQANILFYSTFDGSVPISERKVVVSETEVHPLVKKVLSQLPEPEELTNESYEVMFESMKNFTSAPHLIHFSKSESDFNEPNIDLKRLKALLPSVMLGRFDCQKYSAVCSTLYLRKFPAFLLFKPGGSYEFHYGRLTSYDVARFAREALSSQVHTLTPADFPGVVESQSSWFIDFFAPWCPPCMKFLPHWKKASQTSGHLVKFGTVDCTVHVSLCRQYNINSYPTAILYNQSMPHKFHGTHTQKHVEEFIQDILDPTVVSLTPLLFEEVVNKKPNEEMWVIDFFAPWCGPCQQLAPQWRKLAKMLKHLPTVHIGEVDCQLHHSLCYGMGVNSYPTIRLFPRDSVGSVRYFSYNGWNRDAFSLQAWIYNFLPTKVTSLNSVTYKEMLSEKKPMLIDYYAPWCVHCQSFAPEFEKIARAVDGKVITAKVNCEDYPQVCQSASIRAYPTLMFYRGRKNQQPQHPVGNEIHTFTFNEIIAFLEETLNTKFQTKRLRDEL